MPAQTKKLFRLQCQPQHYPWGRVGLDSMISWLAPNACAPDLELKEDTPLAELWMGTHPNGPSHLYDDPSVTLHDHLAKHPELLGEASKRFPSPMHEPKEGHIPFLFKILTCKQALPLQIHPDRELAHKLHEEDPQNFNDVNHKPEIGVCLSPNFLGFAGFRPLEQISALLSLPPIAEAASLLPSHVALAVKDYTSKTATSEDLRTLWGKIIALKPAESKKAANRLFEAAREHGTELWEAVLKGKDAETLSLAFEKMEKYYSGDPGLFAAGLFMNLIELEPGHGIYVGADEPHAWLDGEIVELMATSDNVLNVGFMPAEDKNDPGIVTKALTCTPRPADRLLLEKQSFKKSRTGSTTVFKVPTEEFSILHTVGPDTISPFAGPAIYIVLDAKGEGTISSERVDKGTVLFVGSGTEVEVDEGVETWAAFWDGSEEVAHQVGGQ